MITYTIAGALPAPWEDFLSDSEVAPNVTICANEPHEFNMKSEDGWVDVSVMDKILTEQRAKDILQEITGDSVEIRMMRVCQSI